MRCRLVRYGSDPDPVPIRYHDAVIRPNPKHLAVERYVPPEEFVKLGAVGESLGFLFVASGPLVRSSYKAGEFFVENYLNKNNVSVGV